MYQTYNTHVYIYIYIYHMICEHAYIYTYININIIGHFWKNIGHKNAYKPILD